jgi:putative thioredoxin
LEAVLPSQADRLAAEAELLAAAGDGAGATGALEAALAADARHPRALLGLARLAAADDREADALAFLERVPPGTPLAREAERLAAELRTRADAHGDEGALRARIAAAPDDLDARLGLGRLLAARRRYEEALGELLESVRRDPSFADEAARRAMLDVFELVGPRDPLTERYRSELAKTLFR